MKPIYIKDENGEVKYTLEFNRESVKFAEDRGFDISEVSKYPLTKVYEFFYYAFRMHHKNLSKGQTDAILDDLGGIANMPESLLPRLGELYLAPFDTLGEERKNSTMTVEL